MHYQTSVCPWWDCLALKHCFSMLSRMEQKMCIPLQGKVHLTIDLKPKRACHLKKNHPNIYKKVVTYLAETTPSQVGICGNLGNKGKLYSEHALPRLLWYLSISKRQLLCINYSDLCKLLRLKRNDWVPHPKTWKTTKLSTWKHFWRWKCPDHHNKIRKTT